MWLLDAAEEGVWNGFVWVEDISFWWVRRVGWLVGWLVSWEGGGDGLRIFACIEEKVAVEWFFCFRYL